MLHVIRYLVEPGARQAFEAAVGERRERQDAPHAWYELVLGAPPVLSASHTPG